MFVLQRQLLVFSFGGTLSDLSPVHSPVDSPVSSHAKTAGLDDLAPKPGHEINLGRLYDYLGFISHTA